MSTQDSIPLRVVQGSLFDIRNVYQWVGRTGPDDDNLELINFLPHVEVPDDVVGVGCFFAHSLITSGGAQPGDPVQVGGNQDSAQLLIPVGEHEPSADAVRQWFGAGPLTSGDTREQEGIPIPPDRDLWILANALFSPTASGFAGSYVLRRGVTDAD